jgi:hypothetical protein
MSPFTSPLKRRSSSLSPLSHAPDSPPITFRRSPNIPPFTAYNPKSSPSTRFGSHFPHNNPSIPLSPSKPQSPIHDSDLQLADLDDTVSDSEPNLVHTSSIKVRPQHTEEEQTEHSSDSFVEISSPKKTTQKHEEEEEEDETHEHEIPSKLPNESFQSVEQFLSRKCTESVIWAKAVRAVAARLPNLSDDDDENI